MIIYDNLNLYFGYETCFFSIQISFVQELPTEFTVEQYLQLHKHYEIFSSKYRIFRHSVTVTY